MPNGRRRQTNTAHANRQRNLQRAIEVQATQVHVAPVVVEALEMADVRSGEVKKLKGQILGLKNKINNIEKQLKKKDQMIEAKMSVANHTIKELKKYLNEGVDHLETAQKKIQKLERENYELKEEYKLRGRALDTVQVWFKTAQEGKDVKITQKTPEGVEATFLIRYIKDESPVAEVNYTPQGVEWNEKNSRFVIGGGHYGDY